MPKVVKHTGIGTYQFASVVKRSCVHDYGYVDEFDLHLIGVLVELEGNALDGEDWIFAEQICQRRPRAMNAICERGY